MGSDTSPAVSFQFSNEKIKDVFDECLPLSERHSIETSKGFPFKPDKESYIAMEEAGHAAGFFIRAGHQLIGFAAFLLQTHPHTGMKQAFCDSIYVIPEYRGLGIGRKFIGYCDVKLAELGAEVIQHPVPFGGFGAKLGSMGYVPLEMIYQKRIK